VRVLIADDHRLILDGIRRALQEADDIEIVGEAQSGTQVLPLVARTSPDLVLLDMRMPGMDGLTCLDRIKQRHPNVKVAMLSVSTDAELIRSAMKRGASAYIVKSVNPTDLPSALRQVFEGTFYSVAGLPDLLDDLAPGHDEAGLTDRELSILKAAAQGLSNAAIAKELWLSQQTVKFHLTNVYRKLDVSNRTEATRYAYQHGLIDTQPAES
jgi:DNA-binding NarL/FixJ family response regulator